MRSVPGCGRLNAISESRESDANLGGSGDSGEYRMEVEKFWRELRSGRSFNFCHGEILANFSTRRSIHPLARRTLLNFLIAPDAVLPLTCRMRHLILFPALALPFLAPAAENVVYDEAKIPAYTLPEVLRFEDGAAVKTAEDWGKRRAELLGLFAAEIYGKTPVGRPEAMRFELRKKVEGFLGGKATLEEIRIHFSAADDGPFLDLLVIKPATVPASGVPTFLGLNFTGNHGIHPSTEITLTTSWMQASDAKKKDGLVVDHLATEKSRGVQASRWPVEKLIDAGTALATFYYGDIDPDFDDGFENGIHALFGKPGPDEWGSIGAWAWGASRALDYLATDPAIDDKRVALMGHSRLGKTALWAGAQDERFAMVIANNSGCGGAALSKRYFGEQVGRINTVFPHWFSDTFQKYNENEAAPKRGDLVSKECPAASYSPTQSPTQYHRL